MNPSATTSLPREAEGASEFLKRPLHEVLAACTSLAADELRQGLELCAWLAPVEFLALVATRTSDPDETVRWSTRRPIMPGDLFSCMLGQIPLGRKITDDPSWPPMTPEDSCGLLDPFYEAGKEDGAGLIRTADDQLCKAVSTGDVENLSETSRLGAHIFQLGTREARLTYGHVSAIAGLLTEIGMECRATRCAVNALLKRMNSGNAALVYRMMRDESTDYHRNTKIAHSWFNELLVWRLGELGWGFGHTTRFVKAGKPDQHQVVLVESGNKVVMTHRPNLWHECVSIQGREVGQAVLVPPTAQRGPGRGNGNLTFHDVEFHLDGPPSSSMISRLANKTL